MFFPRKEYFERSSFFKKRTRKYSLNIFLEKIIQIFRIVFLIAFCLTPQPSSGYNPGRKLWESWPEAVRVLARGRARGIFPGANPSDPQVVHDVASKRKADWRHPGSPQRKRQPRNQTATCLSLWPRPAVPLNQATEECPMAVRWMWPRPRSAPPTRQLCVEA